MKQLSAHFTTEEFACHDGTPYPEAWIEERLLPLVKVLEAIRPSWDRPITVVSGYRSPAHNLAVGGAQASQHMQGRAADIQIVGITPARVHALLLQMLESGQIEIGGLGLYPSWVHVDVRPRPADGHLAQWSGVKFGDEVA